MEAAWRLSALNSCLGASAMKIDSIETFPVLYPVAGRFKFFETPDGRGMGRPSVAIKVTADEGVVGWGEAVPTPRWSYETIESVVSTIGRYLAPELAGVDASDLEGVHQRMDRAIAGSFSTGQPICKAGIDQALFDLTGRVLGQSAAERWGRNDRDSVTLSWTLNPRTIEDAEAEVARAHERGCASFNIKVAPDPEFDLALCRRVRELAPEAVLWVDANGGYDLETALRMAPRFADLGMLAFEQPVPANRLSWFRKLKARGALPIVLDEGVVSLVDLEEFHRLGMLDGVAIKVARCGGLTEAVKQVRFLEENGLMFLASGLTDPDLSLAASLALFGAFGLKHPAALNGPQFLTESVLKKPIAIEAGEATVPTGPGLGVEVDPARLAGLAAEPGQIPSEQGKMI